MLNPSAGSGVAVVWASLSKDSWEHLDTVEFSPSWRERGWRGEGRASGRGLDSRPGGLWPRPCSFQSNPASLFPANKIHFLGFPSRLVYTSSWAIFTILYSQTTEDQNRSIYSEVFPAFAVPTWTYSQFWHQHLHKTHYYFSQIIYFSWAKEFSRVL